MLNNVITVTLKKNELIILLFKTFNIFPLKLIDYHFLQNTYYLICIVF